PALAVKAFDDKIYIAELDGAIFTPLELCVVHGDEECSTKTESPDCVKDGTVDGTKYLIQTNTDSHKGYLGVSKGFIQVFSSYADASYSKLIVDGDKVRIRYRNAENSEYTVVSMSPGTPIGIQSLKRSLSLAVFANDDTVCTGIISDTRCSHLECMATGPNEEMLD
ncbi:hypothetical protein BG000_006285, partial [Podila horticola]